MDFDLEKAPAGVAYKLLVGLVAPRPIALITSMDENGRLNAAPFSAYNYLCTDPPIVGVGVTNRPDQKNVPKDTARNIRRTGEFVVNVVTEDIAEKMNLSLTDADVASFLGLMKPSIDGYNVVDQLPDNLPPVKYPRTPGQRPQPGHRA